MTLVIFGGDPRQRRPRSSNLNAVAERLVLSLKSECLNKIVPLGERHLRLAISQFVEHYHRERNHQGLDNALIDDSTRRSTGKRIRRRPLLGGLLNYYERAA
jgi:transposase InsO family protein